MQFPLPAPSKLQPVLPQKRPDQPAGAVNSKDDPGGRENPPSPSSSAPLPESVPGQIVLLQRFSMVNIVPEATLPSRSSRRMMNGKVFELVVRAMSFVNVLLFDSIFEVRFGREQG